MFGKLGRRAAQIAALTMIAATVNLSGSPARADSDRVAAPVYEIEFQHSGLCLTVYNGAPMGSQAMQWNCDGYANGQWTFEFVDEFYAKIRNVHSGKCLTVYAGATWASPVMQWNCDGYANGLWYGQLVEQGSSGRDWYILYNKAVGLCLNISAIGPALGRPTILSGCAPTNFANKVTWYPPN